MLEDCIAEEIDESMNEGSGNNRVRKTKKAQTRAQVGGASAGWISKKAPVKPQLSS